MAKMTMELGVDEVGDILRACHQCTLRYSEVIQRQSEYQNVHTDYVDVLIAGMKRILSVANNIADELKKQPYTNTAVVDSFIHDMNCDLARAERMRESYEHKDGTNP